MAYPHISSTLHATQRHTCTHMSVHAWLWCLGTRPCACQFPDVDAWFHKPEFHKLRFLLATSHQSCMILAGIGSARSAYEYSSHLGATW